MHGAGGSNTGANVNLGIQVNIPGMDTTKSVLETGKLLYDIFGKKIGDIRNPEKEMEQLYKNARYLFARKDDVEEITRESPNVATRESRLWLEDVKKLEVEVQSIKDEHMRCSNVLLRPTLGKRVGDVIEEITDLNNKRPKLKGKEFSNAPLERVERQIVEINSSTDSKPRLQRILALKEDVGIRKIGIGTKIKSLPSSLGTLVNIRGLYLKSCPNFVVLPSLVGELKQLEVLHLGGSTAIKYLPREVGELTCLKRLIVGFKKRNCSQNDEWNMKLRVPTGIIPKLPYLEELSLYVYDSYYDHVAKEQWDDESMEVVVEELCWLEHLTYLDAYFPKVECLNHFLRHSKSLKATSSWFRRFRFRVGTQITDISLLDQDQVWERYLVYNSGFGTSHAAIMETLAHCSNFCLQDHRTARKLSELGMANMNELKECRIKGCDKMENLFDGDEQQETCALLPNLKKLDIESLPELRSLCDGPLLPGSLSKLTDLRLYKCKNLKKVFQLGIIRQLWSLAKLRVYYCWKMEEIIEIDEEEEMSMSVASHTHNVISYNNDRLIPPNIKHIELRFLPELDSICGGFSNFDWPSLETIEILECPKLKSLSFLSNGTNIVAPALRVIYCESEWWEALEWEDNDIKQQLQPFFFPLVMISLLQPPLQFSSSYTIFHIVAYQDGNKHTDDMS